MCFPIFLCAVDTVDVVPNNALILRLIVIRCSCVKLVVNNGVLPFAIYGSGQLKLVLLLRRESLTSEEDEAVHPDGLTVFVMLDTDLINQTVHVTQAT